MNWKLKYSLVVLGLVVVLAGVYAVSERGTVNEPSKLDHDPSSQLSKMLKSAHGGNVQADISLGLLYYRGRGVSQSYIKAISWFKKAAGKNDVMAEYLVGKSYYFQGNFSHSLVWSKKAANQNYAPAETLLSFMYSEGQGVIKSTGESLYWNKKAAIQGFAIAEWNLSDDYYKGDGFPINYAEAAYWARKSARQHFVLAETALGGLYASGYGVPKNYAKALSWWEKAAKQGDVLSEILIGSLYIQGKGVPENGLEAEFWFKKAIAQSCSNEEQHPGLRRLSVEFSKKRGCVNAELSLGMIYLDGAKKVIKNYPKAIPLLMDAAKRGSGQADYNLGESYYHGWGVPQNSLTAIKWFKRAEKKDIPKAGVQIYEIENH